MTHPWSTALALFLASAIQAPADAAIHSSDTAITGWTSGPTVLNDHAHHVFLADLQIIESAERRIYVIRLARSWDGVHPGMRLDTAWRDGRKLAFRKAPRGAPFCTKLHCNARLIGRIFVTEDIVRTAATHGFRARLTGIDGAIDIRIPASLFARSQSVLQGKIDR